MASTIDEFGVFRHAVSLRQHRAEVQGTGLCEAGEYAVGLLDDYGMVGLYLGGWRALLLHHQQAIRSVEDLEGHEDPRSAD